jgi:hypothetical protein
MRPHHLGVFAIATLIGPALLAQVARSSPPDDQVPALLGAYLAHEREIRALHQQRIPDHERMSPLLDKHFSTAIENALSLDDIEIGLLFRAVQTHVFYLGDPESARLLVRLSDELNSRSGSTDPVKGDLSVANHDQATYNALINTRQFEMAHRYHLRKPERVTPLMMAIGDSLRHHECCDDKTLIVLPPTRTGKMEAHRPRIESGNWLVGIVPPSCHFSRLAMEYLDRNDSVWAAMPSNVLWVASQVDTAQPQPLLEWNLSSQRINVAIAYRDRGWHDLLDVSTTPRFYLIGDGKVLDVVEGWPGPQQAQRLVAAIQSAFPQARSTPIVAQ